MAKKKKDLKKLAYWEEVRRITNENKHLVPGIEKRSWKRWHLDHMISIAYGWKHGIKAEAIAHPSNLQMLTRRSNLDKKDDNLITEANRWLLDKT